MGLCTLYMYILFTPMYMYIVCACVCVCTRAVSLVYMYIKKFHAQITLTTLGREGRPSSDVRPTLLAERKVRPVKLSSSPTKLLSLTVSRISSVIWRERGTWILLVHPRGFEEGHSPAHWRLQRNPCTLDSTKEPLLTGIY